MKRILALVEGQTEEAFIMKVLAPHLQARQISIQPVIIATKRVKAGGKFKGGVTSYGQFERDLKNLLRDRGAALITTMIDYYALPRDFPGQVEEIPRMTCYERVEFLENTLRDAHAGVRHFLPYLSLHEFEALLLTGPEEVAAPFPAPEAAARLAEIVGRVESPEEVNDGPDTHPAARLDALLARRYRKLVHGPTIAERIGLARMRQSCPHFDAWVSRLEEA